MQRRGPLYRCQKLRLEEVRNARKRRRNAFTTAYRLHYTTAAPPVEIQCWIVRRVVIVVERDAQRVECQRVKSRAPHVPGPALVACLACPLPNCPHCLHRLSPSPYRVSINPFTSHAPCFPSRAVRTLRLLPNLARPVGPANPDPQTPPTELDPELDPRSIHPSRCPSRDEHGDLRMLEAWKQLEAGGSWRVVLCTDRFYPTRPSTNATT